MYVKSADVWKNHFWVQIPTWFLTQSIIHNTLQHFRFVLLLWRIFKWEGQRWEKLYEKIIILWTNNYSLKNFVSNSEFAPFVLDLSWFFFCEPFLLPSFGGFNFLFLFLIFAFLKVPLHVLRFEKREENHS